MLIVAWWAPRGWYVCLRCCLGSTDLQMGGVVYAGAGKFVWSQVNTGCLYMCWGKCVILHVWINRKIRLVWSGDDVSPSQMLFVSILVQQGAHINFLFSINISLTTEIILPILDPHSRQGCTLVLGGLYCQSSSLDWFLQRKQISTPITPVRHVPGDSTPFSVINTLVCVLESRVFIENW